MRSKLTLCVVLSLAAAAYAKDPKVYQTGSLVQMESVQCSTSETCQEYVLQSETVTYRIRPSHEKHPALLSVGERAEFRLQKDKLLLRGENLESKEHEYIVVSMAPRSDRSAADATPFHVNHLQ
jgi:urease accessory protein UreE